MHRSPYNVDGYRQAARRRLPRAVFDFVDGGAADEGTMRRNVAAFDDYRFEANVLEDVSGRNLGTTICGTAVDSPIILAPTGLVGIVHPDGERAAVLAADQRGIIAVASSASTYTIEELVEGAERKPWFQLYPFHDSGFRKDVVDRVAKAGYAGLCFTVDCAVAGKRERDLANRMTVRPLKITAPSAVDFGRHPRWLSGILRHRRVTSPLMAPPGTSYRPGLLSLVSTAGASAAGVVSLFNDHVTWQDFEWLRDYWKGPLAVKGILNPTNAKRAADLGADLIIVSNHGGRQLDGLPASLDSLPRILDAVAGQAEVVLDGGVRRGSDVAKALCLGAKACMVGRPWVYGLAVAGTSGVNSVVGLLEDELRTTLALLGQPDVTKLDASYLLRGPGAVQMQKPASTGSATPVT